MPPDTQGVLSGLNHKPGTSLASFFPASVTELMPLESIWTARTGIDSRGKFGRVLADFDLEAGLSLCNTMILERLAVEYRGQSKSEIRAEHEANWDYLDQR